MSKKGGKGCRNENLQYITNLELSCRLTVMIHWKSRFKNKEK